MGGTTPQRPCTFPPPAQRQRRDDVAAPTPPAAATRLLPLVIDAPVHDPGAVPSARRRVSAARKAVRVIARKTFRYAETLRAPPGNSPPPARQLSGTRQSSATRPATLRGQHGNTPPTATLR